MVVTAADLRKSGVDLPLMVGGAALTQNFTLTRIAPAYDGPVFYANEAMQGLSLANRLTDEQTRPVLESEWQAKRKDAESDVREAADNLPPAPSQSRYEAVEIPAPPDLELHTLHEIPIKEIFPLVSRAMLYGKHLGLRMATQRLENPADKQAQDLKQSVERVLHMAEREKLISPRMTWRWFPVYSENEVVSVLDPATHAVRAQWTFPRERTDPFRCAADWIKPRKLNGDDYLCVFVTTAGDSVQPRAKQLQDQGELLASHILSALAIEMAEASAEWLHRKIRADWGIGDPANFTWQDLLRTAYRGIRLSFGYPACPNLDDQIPLFDLLRPQESIGVTLTDEMMMVPESSVSALVFHHPRGEYFTA
jgi:5-methyltetrahydrofolate--homocysteine methyltransferase